MAGGRLRRAHRRARRPRRTSRRACRDVDLKFTRAEGRPACRARCASRGNAELARRSREDRRADGLGHRARRATAKGSVDLDRQLIDARAGAWWRPISARLLDEMGLPPLAKSARVDAKADGTLRRSRASAGDASVQGVERGRPQAARARSPSSASSAATLRLDKLAGPAVRRAASTGTAPCSCGRSAPASRCKSPIVDVKLDAARHRPRDAGAERTTSAGRLSLHADANGPLDAVTAHVTIPAGTPITLLGDDYALGPVEVALRPTSGHGADATVKALHLDAHGGRRARHPRQGRPRAPGSRSRRRARQAAARRACPASRRPTCRSAASSARSCTSAAGPIAPSWPATSTWPTSMVRGVKLGRRAPGADADARRPERRARRRHPRPPVRPLRRRRAGGAGAQGADACTAEVDFRRVEIEALAPELVAFGDGARHRQRPRSPSTSSPAQPLALDVLLPELWLSIARAVEGAERRDHHPARARRGGAPAARQRARRPRSCSTRRTSRPTAAIWSSPGGSTARRSSGSLSGHLDLELLQPFLGAAGHRAAVRRSARRAAGARHAGQARPARRGGDRQPGPPAPEGLRPRRRHRLGHGSRSTHGGVGVAGPGRHRRRLDDEAGRARRRSGPGFAPENIQADVDGDVSARLLAFVAPDAVSDAQGKAHVRARLRGTLHKPEMRGRLDLGAIDFRLRDLGTRGAGAERHRRDQQRRRHPAQRARACWTTRACWSSARRACAPGASQFTSLVPFKPGEFDLPLHGERLDLPQPRRRSRSTTWRSIST